MSQQVTGDETESSDADPPDIIEDGWVAVEKFEKDGQNPNQMSERKFGALKTNIERYGFIVPVIADSEYVIADGEHRLKAAKELDMDEVRAVVLDVDEVDRKIVRQVMNKVTGDHDLYDDADELERILGEQTQGDIAGLLGESENHIDNLVDMARDDDETEAIADDVSDSESDVQSDLDANDSQNDERDSDGSDDADDNSLEPPSDEPDTLDGDDIETEHECPSCGYEW